MSISRSQSKDQPIARKVSRIRATLAAVQAAGSTPRAIAAFSAGRPKASQPMGCRTAAPWRRAWRARTSLIV
ncbi:MAG: hypothetical protein R3F59_05850 [Myxococcota bacterium]